MLDSRTLQPSATPTASAASIQLVLDSQVWTHSGVALRRGALGLTLVATRPFAAGSVLYTTALFMTDPGTDGIRARTLVDGAPEDVIVTAEHMVRFRDLQWWDVPGCFTNHSCAPNSSSVFHAVDAWGNPTRYDQVALTDIAAGTEVTCDYTRFDWGADGYDFDCRCGAPDCLGRIDGFGGLPRVLQERTARTTSMEARRRWEFLVADKAPGS